MDATLGLVGSPWGDGGGGGGGGGGGVPSDGSTTAGSILTMAKEDNNDQDMGMSAEVSSPYPVDDDGDDNLELGLGLSIGTGGGGGGGGGGGLKSNAAAPCCGQYARILTAKDFPSGKNPNSSNSSTKRTVPDSLSSTSVVGWPPIRRVHRLPTSANQTKPHDDQSSSVAEEPNRCSLETKGFADKGYGHVKVNMDGALIGRKVNLDAHHSYKTLAQTLEDMFCRTRSRPEAAAPSKLLDGTSEFVLTYEDKDGDCMLVGDVPWPMFLSSVKRLRIMRNSERHKLSKHRHTMGAPMFQEKNVRRRMDAV